MEKYTTDQAKVHLNSDMEAIRNSIMKNVRQMQNFRRITWDLKNSKHNLKYNFIFLKNVDQQKEQVICYQVSLITKETTFQTKEMDLSLRHKNKFKLTNHKTDHYAENVRVRSPCPCPYMDWILRLKSKSPYSLRMWCNTG